MKFCPNCGSTLRTQRKHTGIIQICPKCGYEELSSKSTSSPRIIGKTRVTQPMIVEHRGTDEASLPKTKVVCPKCGNNEAYWWMQQTRSADEATTRFFRCVKCSYVWREYD